MTFPVEVTAKLAEFMGKEVHVIIFEPSMNTMYRGILELRDTKAGNPARWTVKTSEAYSTFRAMTFIEESATLAEVSEDPRIKTPFVVLTYDNPHRRISIVPGGDPVTRLQSWAEDEAAARLYDKL